MPLPLDEKLAEDAIMANSQSHEVGTHKAAAVLPFERKNKMPKSNLAVAPSRQPLTEPKHRVVPIHHIARKRGLKYKGAIIEMIDDLLVAPQGHAIEMSLREFGGEKVRENVVAAIHRATKKTVGTASPEGSDKIYIWIKRDKFYNMFRPKTQ